MDNKKEKIMLLKVANGDESAFTDLYAIWESQLSSFIFQIIKSKELTAEIIQDVFLKIWLNRELLLEVNSFKSYLFVVSRNHALNVFKKTIKELSKVQRLEEDLIRCEEEDESKELDEIKLSLIREAIDQLPKRRKEVFLLHRNQKMTYAEIANHLGIGKESVKTHIKLALKAVRSHVNSKLSLLAILIDLFFKNI